MDALRASVNPRPYRRLERPKQLQLVHPGGINDLAGERNYLGFTVASGRGRSVP
jgi:hypothetical protein